MVEAGLRVNPIHVIDLAVVLPAFALAGASALRGRATGLFLVGPMLTFSVLVLASLVAAVRYLREDRTDDPLANPRAEGHTEKSR
ncbi:hypothetical protein [Nocardioides daphniae]|uniref:Uncharacterized protein n=1 Tax=Nocardioides daphniae TaxID=402297 RepID=A0A4P7UE38_9ACTN|nr:hypothetical protein [Nocardioides daphniae]QCC77608.1 hypothetical protein E2C04_11265 [Nocardioides daphniae]